MYRPINTQHERHERVKLEIIDNKTYTLKFVADNGLVKGLSYLTLRYRIMTGKIPRKYYTILQNEHRNHIRLTGKQIKQLDALIEM